MKKSFKKYEKAGLPGGPNELKRFTQGFIISQRGQWDYPGLPTAVPTPTGKITMKGVEDDLLGIDNLGNAQYMTPGNNYQFEGDMVYEIPMGKKGGIKKPSKKYSKSLMSRNILFTKNPLLKKPKSVKNKIFDPNSPYFQPGGEIEYNQLPEKYKYALQNFIYPNVSTEPNDYEENENGELVPVIRPGYNPTNNTITYDPNNPIENINNDWWREHELFHQLQNLAGGENTSDAGMLLQKPNPYVASNDSMGAYYNRRDSDVEKTIDNMIAQNPNLKFIPREKLAQSTYEEGMERPGFIGAEDLQYSDPSTLEGEARQYEQYIEEGNPSIFNKKAFGGVLSPKDLDPDTLKKYLSDLRSLENSIKKGYRNNKWYPHSSIEGGANTIAYGHKLQPGESFSSGLTEQEARDLQKKDVLAHQTKAEKFVDDKYGKGTYDKLPQNSQMLLTDYAYNLGSLNKFPSFVEGVVKGDKDKMLKEYERRGLSERNKWTKNVINTTDFSKKSNNNSQYLYDISVLLNNLLSGMFHRQDGGELSKASYGHSIGNLIRKQPGGETDLPQNVGITYLSEDDRSYYSPLDDTIYLNPNASDAELNHELVHAWQNRTGRLRSNPNLPQQRPPIVASDEQAASYYTRKGDEVDQYLSNLKNIYPEMTGNNWTEDLNRFLPDQIKYDKAVEPLMYQDPNTMEGEAEYLSQTRGRPGGIGFRQNGGFIVELDDNEIEEYIKGGYIVEDISIPSLTRMDKGGGPNTCPPDHYWNGEACVPTGRTFTPIDPNYVAQHPDEARFIQNEAEVTVSKPASDIAKFRDEWKRNNPRDQWLDKKKRYYLDVLSNPGLNKLAGVNMSYFPSDVRQNYLDEYEYLANTYAIDKIGDKRGFNPKRRGEWVDQLSEGEKNAMAESKYSSKLQPSYWARALAGTQELGNFVLKNNPISAIAGVDEDLLHFNIPGLTKKEQKEIAESKFGALEMLSPIDLPGAAIANYVKNRGLSTGSDYKELPGIASTEKMANVSDLEATLFNPITYLGLEALPELGINAVRGLGRGAGSLARGTKQLVTGSEAIPATENLVKGLSEVHPTAGITETNATSFDELAHSGVQRDPNYHAERFNQKKQEVVEALKTPEGKKRLQGYIDNSPNLSGKTPDQIIAEVEQIPFTTKSPYYRSRHNPQPFYEKQIDELIAKGELDPSVKEQSGWVVGKDGSRYNAFDIDPNSASNIFTEGFNNPSKIKIGQNFTPYDAQHIFEHELQHFFGRGELSEADVLLKDIELIDEVALDKPGFSERLNRYNPFRKKNEDLGTSITGDIYGTGSKNPNRKEGLVRQRDYWNFGTGGGEKAPMAAEIRENMLQRGIIKNRYDEITPEMLREHYKIYKNTTGNKYQIRPYDIMKDKKKNFEILSKAINKLPVMVPLGIGAGATGAAAYGANDGANYKSGGLIEKKSSLLKANNGIEISDNSLFNDKLQEIADELGVTVDDLVGIMQHESRLNPSAVNPYTGAVGLIQFMPNTAKGLGTSIDALKQMSAVDQLDYVKKFYKPIAGKAKDIGDLYMYTFLPAAVGKPDDFVIGVKGSDSKVFGINQDALYKQNAVFDSEKKGYYTVGDVKKRISNFTGKSLTAPNRKKTIKRIPGKVEDTVKVIKRKHYVDSDKKEETIPVDPRIEQLAAFSKIMAPTSENIFQLYNQGISSQMKYGGLTKMDKGGGIQGIEGLKEDFADRLSQFINDAKSQGINLKIGSGYRSYEKQKQLWEDALKKYGSAEVARKWVAPPGSSYHNKGLAVDLHDENSRALGKEENQEATAWAHANAKKYGLHFRMGNEPWHIEPIEFTGEDDEHTDENDITGDILIPDLQTESKVEYDDDYSDWSPNKKEVVTSDPRLQQLEAFSKIISPSSQNINMMFQDAIKGNMKKGGFILEVDDRDIQKYLDGGYIVEEID